MDVVKTFVRPAACSQSISYQPSPACVRSPADTCLFKPTAFQVSTRSCRSLLPCICFVLGKCFGRKGVRAKTREISPLSSLISTSLSQRLVGALAPLGISHENLPCCRHAGLSNSDGTARSGPEPLHLWKQTELVQSCSTSSTEIMHSHLWYACSHVRTWDRAGLLEMMSSCLRCV